MGSFNFTDRITGQPGTSSTGSGIASFLVGQLDNANACTAPPGDLHTGANSFYVQDSWRATRKLTINYGLRWDQFWPTWEHKDRMSTFDPNLVNPATGTKGALSIFGQGSGRNGRHAIEERYFKAFGPQLGLAYAWNDRTVLRASYGISYGPAYIKWLGSNGPYTVVSSDGFSASRYATTLDNGITPAFNWTSGFPVPFPSSFPILDPTLDNGGTITFMDPDNRPPMNQNVSFEIERQLPGQMSLRVAYIGLLAHHLQTEYPYDLNSVPLKNLTLGSDLLEADVNSPQARAAGIKVPYSGFSGSVAQALKPFPQYNHINYVGAMLGNSTYHSLQVNLQKRLGHGLSFLASYAVQKQLSNVDFPGYNGQGSLSVRHPELIKQDGKRLLGKDQPQNFNISWDYELPFGTGHAFAGHASKPLNYVIGGWRLSAIQNYFSGRPISITTRATNPIAGVWPELVPGVPIRATGCGDYDPNNPAKNRYLNINAFRSDPTTYRGYSLGNFSQIPNIRSCGFQDEAIGLDKQLVLHEQWRLSLGTYWQNALNRHPWRGLVTDLGSPAFGQYTDVNPSRFIQFYMRLEF